MSQIPPLTNYFWVIFAVEQLFSSVQLFKCQFHQATLMVIESVVKEDCNFSNFGTKAFLVSCFLGHRSLHAVLLAKSTPRWWQKSNDPGNFSAMIIEKFQIVHRTLYCRLFSKCMLTCMMYDGQKKTRKDNLSVILKFAAFVPSLHAQSPSGNSLTFISWYPDPSGCKIVKMDV